MTISDPRTYGRIVTRAKRRGAPPPALLQWLAADLTFAIPMAAQAGAPPTPGRYLPSLAWLTSVASTWAYADWVTFREVMRLCMGAVHVEPIRASNPATLVDTQAYYVCGDHGGGRKLGILAFRGTEFGTGRLTSVFTDMIVDPVPFYAEGKSLVHGGFYRAIACVWHDIIDVLAENERDIGELLITGHSLGGALAALAAAMLFADLPAVMPSLTPLARFAIDPGQRASALGAALWDRFVGLYTFGQPMVGNHAFVAHCRPMLEGRTFRHVYRKDWVPTLPPASTGVFEHFGQQYSATSGPWQPSSTVRQAPCALTVVPATLAFVAQQFPLGRRIPFPYSIADHIPQNYVDASKRAVPEAPTLFP